MRPSTTLPCVLLLSILGTASLPTLRGADPAVLYEAALGNLPSGQGFLYLTDPLFGARAKQTLIDGAAQLDTSAATTDKAGWFSHLPPFGKHPGQPQLDSEAGFFLSFTVRILAENHANEHRAGFSVIATAANLDAIELGFWTDEIWAQSGPDFRHAEGTTIDTSTGRIRYDLELRSGRYRLSANGQPVLDGNLRRYDSFGLPYTVPEFLFLGDDTTSAQARAELTRVAVGPLPRLSVARRGNGLSLSVEVEAGRRVEFQSRTGSSDWETLGSTVATEARAVLDVPLEPTGTVRIFRAALR